MLYNGDCLEVLGKLESNSVHSLVTDPPAGISFMGKDWDSDKGGRDEWIAWLTQVMSECKRVLKPGGHALVWSIPRTSHWSATAIENAGFEIRDVVTHLFGQGFPKSLDISKAIDKKAGAKREVIGHKDIAYPDSDCWGEPNKNSRQGGYQNFQGKEDDYEKRTPITAPSTPDAKKWQGYGTALKPAAEFWILARKPLSEKSVAENVLKHGVGGINIDGCRVGSGEDRRMCGSTNSSGQSSIVLGSRVETRTTQGRFPANLVLSHTEHCTHEDVTDRGLFDSEMTTTKSVWHCEDSCAVKMLDGQSGFLHPAGNKNNKPANDYGASSYHVSYGNKADRTYKNDNGGGASRFFYCAKVSPGERGENNKHPTVKALKLMRYLIKLITPQGGIVLDPFMGSGSTGLAALQEGFQFIGIEREKEYFEIAKTRIEGPRVA